jgi:hypothetical protein
MYIRMKVINSVKNNQLNIRFLTEAIIQIAYETLPLQHQSEDRYSQTYGIIPYVSIVLVQTIGMQC